MCVCFFLFLVYHKESTQIKISQGKIPEEAQIGGCNSYCPWLPGKKVTGSSTSGPLQQGLGSIIAFLFPRSNQSWRVWFYWTQKKGSLIRSIPFDAAVMLKLRRKNQRMRGRPQKFLGIPHRAPNKALGTVVEGCNSPSSLYPSHHKMWNGRIHCFSFRLEFCYFSWFSHSFSKTLLYPCSGVNTSVEMSPLTKGAIVPLPTKG